MSMRWEELLDTSPEDVAAAQDVVAGFDTALVNGFARVDERQATALQALAGAVAGSPLAVPVAEAVATTSTGSIGQNQLSALAAARAALLGAVHDALLDRLDTALGRTRADWVQPAVPAADPHPLAVGCRSWLGEVAIAGWRGVDHDLVSAADRMVEGLLAEPSQRRLAVLLDGLTAELSASAPVAAMDVLPARRWADLWTRALLLTWRTGETTVPEPVSGRLLPLGVDVHEHGTAVQVQLHAILETPGAPSRTVRASVAAAKVDTIVGPAVWQLLGAHPHLLTALAEHRALELTDMPLGASGDLVWHDDRATVGDPADPFATASVRLADAVGAIAAPLDRDPVHIAEPVLLEGYRIKDGALELDGLRLSLELDRLPSSGPLTPAAVSGSFACIGLLRWDAGCWTLRPLAVRRKIKSTVVALHNGDWACGPTDPKVAKAQAKSGDAVLVLRERAGRLLRK
ncbi:Uncharacterised protein [Nocardia otitidiscaviarum]|uniref:Uncharacterized protein n=1 Tax=Nocardia otitidiscaviarum TaxID=1823 RepID=A0A378YD47_9NOCA|nr:hypothetical protein [Nocardia otitidiscaviarum]SUA74460.1 Uncharacterised protein [Nocardia otitidiscaviarum]